MWKQNICTKWRTWGREHGEFFREVSIQRSRWKPMCLLELGQSHKSFDYGVQLACGRHLSRCKQSLDESTVCGQGTSLRRTPTKQLQNVQKRSFIRILQRIVICDVCKILQHKSKFNQGNTNGFLPKGLCSFAVLLSCIVLSWCWML